MGSFEIALQVLERGRVVAPDLLQIDVTLGSLYLDLDQPDLSLAVYQQAIEKAPDYPVLYAGEAFALSAVGRLDEARKAFSVFEEKAQPGAKTQAVINAWKGLLEKHPAGN